MSELENVKQILQESKAALVVKYVDGTIKEYYQDRIKDIKEILEMDSNSLKGAIVADKVIGKLAASLLIVAGVKELYAGIISELAIPKLKESGIQFEYEKKVDYIQNKNKTGMCPMELKYKEEQDVQRIYKEIMGK